MKELRLAIRDELEIAMMEGDVAGARFLVALLAFIVNLVETPLPHDDPPRRRTA